LIVKDRILYFCLPAFLPGCEAFCSSAAEKRDYERLTYPCQLPSHKLLAASVLDVTARQNFFVSN
ncbi:hypothetical protein, partial [Undibacterium oligocarboniphilum]|uniref:hypothetical protein n=1 Tax=Undibacterium oligocarboniphilum TaxID=666702 RepID=UPI001CC25EEF